MTCSRREWPQRQQLTLDLAEEFLGRHRARGCTFEPVGVAQGWSPVELRGVGAALQDIGYERIAIGGLVAQKTHEILAVLEAIDEIRDPESGYTCSASPGPSTSPRSSATGSRASTAPRRSGRRSRTIATTSTAPTAPGSRSAIPQVDANPKLQRRIRAGEIDGRAARRLEQQALAAAARATIAARRVAGAGRRARSASTRSSTTTATTAPARTPRCSATRRGAAATARSAATVGIEVAIFRGTERNKRRGFHNLHVFARAPRTATRRGERLRHRSESHDQAHDAAARAATSCACRHWRSGRTPDRTLYSFAVDGKKLPLFAAVSRVKRDAEHQLAGYQRAESIAAHPHDPPLPRDRRRSASERAGRRVRLARAVRAGSAPDRRRSTEIGHLIVPVDETETDEREARLDRRRPAAHRRDPRRRCRQLPVYVTAFITDSVMEQRSQFILVNSTKPLPKGLIHELLPVTPAPDLPLPLLKRRYPAQICSTASTTTPTRRCRAGSARRRRPTGVIKDNSVLKMLAMSIEDGALYDGSTATAAPATSSRC